MGVAYLLMLLLLLLLLPLLLGCTGIGTVVVDRGAINNAVGGEEGVVSLKVTGVVMAYC